MGEWDELIPSDPGLRELHGLYLFLGLFICIFGIFSLFIKERLFLSEAFVATALGIAFGPVGLNLFDPTNFGESSHYRVTLELSRIVLVIQCMAAGVSLPGNYVNKEKLSLAMLLGPVMIYMWLMSALGLYVILGLSFWNALIIGACITPTDPILANSIVQGRFAERHIPLQVRLLLSAESAANDGLGLPFLLLPIYLMRIHGVGLSIGEFIYKVVLYQVLLSILVGAILGYAARKSLQFAERRGLIDKESIVSFSIALAVAGMGALTLMGSDDILAAFVAGSVLTWDHWFNKRIAESHFQEIIDLLLNLAYFVYFGMLIPWSDFGSSSHLEVWRLILVALWIIILRRLPAVMALRRWIPAFNTPREAFFGGWFGPIGGGAIFYSMVAIVYFEIPPTPLFSIVSFVVLASIIVHGGTVSLFHFGITRHATYREWRILGNGTRKAITATMIGRPIVRKDTTGETIAIEDESGREVCEIQVKGKGNEPIAIDEDAGIVVLDMDNENIASSNSSNRNVGRSRVVFGDISETVETKST